MDKTEKLILEFMTILALIGIGVYMCLHILYILMYSLITLFSVFAYLTLLSSRSLSSGREMFNPDKIQTPYVKSIMLLIISLLWLGFSLILLTVEGILLHYIAIMSIISIILLLTCPSTLTIVNILNLVFVFITAKYYLNPGFVGADVWFHMKASETVALDGGLDVLTGTKEYYYPIFHLLVAISKVVSGVNIKASAYFSMVILGLIVPFIIIVIVVTNVTSNNKIAILAAVIYTMADYRIFWIYSPQTTSLGVILYALTIYWIYKLLTTNNQHSIWFILLFLGIINISHPTSSAVVTIGIIGGLVAYWSTYYIFNNQLNKQLFRVVIISLILFSGYNLFVGKSYGMPIISIIIRSLTQRINISNYAARTASIVATYGKIGNMGMYFLFVFSLTPLIAKLKRGDMEKFTMLAVFLLGSIISMAVIGYGFPLLGLPGLLVGRAFPFLYLGIVISFAISSKNKKWILPTVYTILAIIVIIANLYSPITNSDNPPFFSEYFPIYSLSPAEFYGAKTFVNIVEYTNLTSDSFFMKSAIYWWANCRLSEYSSIGTKNGIKIVNGEISIKDYAKKIIILREAYSKHPVLVQTGSDFDTQRIAYHKVYRDLINNHDVIYSNPAISGWWILKG